MDPRHSAQWILSPRPKSQVKPIFHFASARYVSSKRTFGTRIRLAELGTRTAASGRRFTCLR